MMGFYTFLGVEDSNHSILAAVIPTALCITSVEATENIRIFLRKVFQIFFQKSYILRSTIPDCINQGL
jgi:hypothetical protein